MLSLRGRCRRSLIGVFTGRVLKLLWAQGPAFNLMNDFLNGRLYHKDVLMALLFTMSDLGGPCLPQIPKNVEIGPGLKLSLRDEIY